MATQTELEKEYDRGEKAAYLRIIQEAANAIGYTNSPRQQVAFMIAEREAAISALREVCTELGDNDWSDNGHLGDIIRKCVLPHVEEITEKLNAPYSDDDRRKDKERLDFLDSCSRALNARYGTIYHWKLILSSHVVRLFLPGQNPHRDGLGPVNLCDSNCGKDTFTTCREAIDGAMKR